MSTVEERAAPSGHSAEHSRSIAEGAREQQWKGAAFVRDMFMGKFQLGLLDPYPDPEEFVGEPTRAFIAEMMEFLTTKVDPDQTDRDGKIPQFVVDWFKEKGAFGLKIPKEYGGKGFNQTEYNRTMTALNSIDGGMVTLLSGHQSIGVPQPLKLFGTEEQKKKFLPLLADGAISGLALTEDDVGSDPGGMTTTAVPSEDGEAWILNGKKLWCTNAGRAKYISVLANTPGKRSITCFIVDSEWPGVDNFYRCTFMGLRGMESAGFELNNVRVPKENVVGEVGKGLKIALITLNSGRLTVPAMCESSAKACLGIVRRWASTRKQWGQPVGRHDAVAQMIADIAAHTFAIEAINELGGMLADHGGYDIRLEAAMAKLFCTEHGWRIMDETVQIRGGRAYETADSLKARGDIAAPVERIFRDFRVTRIFEGSSEILRLFIAREALDPHLKVAGEFVEGKHGFLKKLTFLPKIIAFYSIWYPSRWLGWGHWPRYQEYGPLATHVRFIERTSRKLSRTVFHLMVRHGAGLQHRQALLFRTVDIGAELFAMTATIGRARMLVSKEREGAEDAMNLADTFCRISRRRVGDLFRAVRRNDDVNRHGASDDVLEGKHEWLERGITVPWPE